MIKLKQPRANQKGLVGLLDLLVVLSATIILLSILINYNTDQQIQNDAERFTGHVETIVKAINAYQADMYSAGVSFRTTDIFPNSLDDLMPNYLQNCTAADNAARRCKLPTQTPWGQNLAYSTQLVSVPVPGGTVDVPGFSLQIPVGLEPTPAYRHTYVAALSQLPFANWNETTGIMTISYGRLGAEVEHEALVRRDGSTTLLDHWDTGGDAAILNTRDITIKNANGTQRSLGRGVVYAFTAKSGETFNQHSCPPGSTPDIMVGPKGLIPENISSAFSEVGAQNAFHIKSGSTYTVKLEYWARESTGAKQWVKRTDGYVNVILSCK